jgi:hypothetical protein
MSGSLLPAPVSGPMVSLDVVSRAAEVWRDSYRYQPEELWFASSGLLVTGEEVVRHLNAAMVLLDRRGWRRDYGMDDDGPEDPGDVDESASMTDMVRYLVRLVTRIVRYEYFSESRALTFGLAMWQVDRDVEWVAARCLNLVLRARTGAPSANYSQWSGRAGRTLDEIRVLVAQASEFARAYGPKEVAA